MKTVILFLILCFNFTLIANEYNSGAYTQTASGRTKSEALARAISVVPYGFTVKKFHFNGYSEHKCVPGLGMVQTSGSYKCKVFYSNR